MMVIAIQKRVRNAKYPCAFMEASEWLRGWRDALSLAPVQAQNTRQRWPFRTDAPAGALLAQRSPALCDDGLWLPVMVVPDMAGDAVRGSLDERLRLRAKVKMCGLFFLVRGPFGRTQSAKLPWRQQRNCITPYGNHA